MREPGSLSMQKRKELDIQSTNRELHWKSSAVFHEGTFENEKQNRVSSLFQLLKRQDEGHEILIAVGAETEKKEDSRIDKGGVFARTIMPYFHTSRSERRYSNTPRETNWIF